MSTCRIGRRDAQQAHADPAVDLDRRPAPSRRWPTHACRSAAARLGVVSGWRGRAAAWRAGGTRAGRRRPARARRRAAVAPGSRSSREPGTRSAKTRTPCTEPTLEAGVGEQRGDLVGGEPAARAAGRPRCGGRRAAPAPAAKWPAIARAMTAACRWATSRREPAAGAQHLARSWPARRRGRRPPRARRGTAPRRRRPGPASSSRSAEVALRPVTGRRRRPRGPAGQGGQGVGAGVDDGDPVAELGHPDREAAGAAADVEDVELRAGRRPRPSTGAERRPDHGGAGAAAALAGRHWHGPALGACRGSSGAPGAAVPQLAGDVLGRPHRPA